MAPSNNNLHYIPKKETCFYCDWSFGTTTEPNHSIVRNIIRLTRDSCSLIVNSDVNIKCPHLIEVPVPGMLDCMVRSCELSSISEIRINIYSLPGTSDIFVLNPIACERLSIYIVLLPIGPKTVCCFSPKELQVFIGQLCMLASSKNNWSYCRFV
jgi:hypothetical protein